MDVEVAAIAAMEGVKADDQLALDLANAMHSLAVKKNTKNLITDVSYGKRKFQQGMLFLDSLFQPVSRGFKSAVVAAQETGRSVPLTVAQAAAGGLISLFTARPGKQLQNQTTANYLDALAGPGVGRAFQNAKEAYGETEFNLMLEQSRQGKPLNLGAGFLPRSVDLKETQIYLDELRAGSDKGTAMKKAAEVYGIPITQLFDAREDQFKYTTDTGEKINISPGRVVAAQVFEPGTGGYNVVSGAIDAVFRLAADPTNLALMYGAGVKTAMRTLVQSNRTALSATDKTTAFLRGFLPGKTGKHNRALFYGRTVDDIRRTSWGQKFGESIAKLKGDEGRAFLADIPEFAKIPASVREVLIQVDNADDVWNVLEVIAKGGDLTLTQFDNMFALMKNAQPNTAIGNQIKRNLDQVRELSVNNVNFGLNAIPAKPTVTGEFFNFVGKVITGRTTDVAPLRKFVSMFTARSNPTKGLLGVGTQLKQSLPKHIQRALSLRPETTMLISNLDAAAKNADDMLKIAFANPLTRGRYQREILEATSQKELDEITHRVNQSIADSVSKQNPQLEIDVQDLVQQEEAYTAEIQQLRNFFSGSNGGAIAFPGTQTRIRYTKLIKDLQERNKKLGIEMTDEAMKRTIVEAVPSMHLLSQAADNFTAQLWDPQDILRATKAHSTLIGPQDSLLRAWANKPRDLATLNWTDVFKIPRKALLANTKNNKLQLKPKTVSDRLLDGVQNNVLKPLWMLRLALMLRIAPEEGLRAAFGGKTNFITTPFERAALLSNKSLGFLGPKVREDKVLSLYNNLGEIVMTSRMTPDDVTFLKNMMRTKDLKDFAAIDYVKIEKLIKNSLLEINTQGVVSDYIIAAAVNGFDIRDIRFAQLTEKTFQLGSSNAAIKANVKIAGPNKTYNSVGDAIADGNEFISLTGKKIGKEDVYVTPYRDKELVVKNFIEKQSFEQSMNTQLDNLFLDDETIALLQKKNHFLAVGKNNEGETVLNVAVGLSGQNAVENAVIMGVNSFQKNVFVQNADAVKNAGFKIKNGNIDLYASVPSNLAPLSYSSEINQEILETLFKSNFDALSLKIDDVQGAAQGMPGAGLFTADESYMEAMGEAAVVKGLFDGRKDVAENSFIMVEKFLSDGSVNPRAWEALWNELSLLAKDPNVVYLVNNGVDATFDYLRTNPTGKATLKEFIERSFNPEDRTFLTDDDLLRGYLESLQYRVHKAIGNPSAKILDKFGKEVPRELVGRVFYANGQKTFPKFSVDDLSWGNQTKMYQFIKNGGVLDGKDWIRYNTHIQSLKLGGKSGRGAANEKFYKEWINLFGPKGKNEYADLGFGQNRIAAQFDLKNRISETGTYIAGTEIKAAGFVDDITDDGFFGISSNLLEKGYGVLITKPSNYLNRDPLFRYAFYDNAKDLIRFMDEPTKTKFIKESEVYIDGNKLWDELVEIAKEPSLENTVTSLDQANTLLKASALNEVLNLFYSTSQRHVASDLFSKYIPFPEIWAEVAKTWGRLIVDNPQKFNRARIAVDNGTEAKPWDSETGFFSKDPKTGKLMFNYVDVFNVLSLGTIPLAGKLINQFAPGENRPDFIQSPYQTAVFGQDLTDKGVRAKPMAFAAGLNLVAQNGFAPGFGPAVTVPARMLLNAIGSNRTIRNFFLGEFAKSNKMFEQLPAWAKKFIIGARGESSDDDDIVATYGNTQMDLYTSYVLAGLVDQTDPLEVQKYLALSYKQARNLFMFRGMAQFSLPTAIQPRIEVEDKNGTWWATQTLVSKYQEMLIENGYDHFQTQLDFVERFGINPIPLKQPGQYNIGKKPVKENAFFFWNQPENKALLKSHPNTAYYIYTDKIEDELYYPAYFQVQSVDLTPEQEARFMVHSQAIFEYEKGKADIREENLSSGEQQRRISDLKMNIEDKYGGIDMFNFQGKPQSISIKSTMLELRSWELDKRLRESPEWEYVEKYLDFRDGLLDVLTKGGTFTYKDKTLAVGKPKYTARVLTGTGDQKVEAREIMIQIWLDLVEEAGVGNNYAQLANELLFYELNPNNNANRKD